MEAFTVLIAYLLRSWIGNFGIPMEKETEIASALERIRAAENIFPRFGVTASDGDLSGLDESDKILGMVSIGVFEGFRVNAFFSA